MIANIGPKGNTIGFLGKFLMDKASAFADTEQWDCFKEVLALLIYGIILFLNIDNFIDMHAICVFLTQNLAPTLLADIYYYLIFRHEKKFGIILCCASLLHKWFLSHFPKKEAFVENKASLK